MIAMHCMNVLLKIPKLASNSQFLFSDLKVGGNVTGILVIELERPYVRGGHDGENMVATA